MEFGAPVVVEAGQRVRVGDVELVIEEADAPELFVRDLDSSRTVRPQGGLLSLPPDSDEPVAQIFAANDGSWLLETDARVGPVPGLLEIAGGALADLPSRHRGSKGRRERPGHRRGRPALPGQRR